MLAVVWLSVDMDLFHLTCVPVADRDVKQLVHLLLGLFIIFLGIIRVVDPSLVRQVSIAINGSASWVILLNLGLSLLQKLL
jgi:hypothetical protein